MNLIDLKERIAISPAFSKEECDFLLDAINAMNAEPDGVLITPNNKVIDTLYAWLSVDGNGLEGIMSMMLGNEHLVTGIGVSRNEQNGEGNDTDDARHNLPLL